MFVRVLPAQEVHRLAIHPDREYVGMGVNVCPVCLKEHDEVVLIDKRLRPTLKRRNFVGWALCTEHEELWQNGYIALIECTGDQQTTLEGAERTGMVAHVRKEAWPNVFNTPVPNTPIAFVQQGVVERLQVMRNATTLRKSLGEKA